jgi:hypothetical protein
VLSSTKLENKRAEQVVPESGGQDAPPHVSNYKNNKIKNSKKLTQKQKVVQNISFCWECKSMLECLLHMR